MYRYFVYRWGFLTAGAVALAVSTGAAHAHDTTGALGGLTSGFLHPILGIDHLLAMFAVGLWGAQIGGRSIWTLPVVFPLIMACGGILGIAGFPLPQVEPAIALSMLILGLAVLTAWNAPNWAAMAVVGAFAIFHGYAHGLELPQAADPLAYGVGFVAATGLIHIAGIGFGLLFARPLHGWVARAAGAAVALAGAYFLVG